MSSRKRTQPKRQGPSCSDPSCSPSGYPSVSGQISTTNSSSLTDSTTAAQTSATTSTTPSSTASSVVAAVSTTSNAGTIAGAVVGSVVCLALVVLGILLYLRARKRKRTPPSSEFMNSIRAGATPILRLDSGAEYVLPEKGGSYPHHSPSVPLPFMQNSYYTSSPMQHMKFPDEMMMTDIPSARPSIEKPLHPQRLSSPQHDAFVAQHHPSTSVGSRRELWGSETEIVSRDLSPVRPSHSSPRTDSVLQFAPRLSLVDQ